jgi:energy-coupling factor transporter ATP-binding protein EcfA2
MEVWLHNIGPIRDAKLELSQLTVLVGPNGSGKTTLTNVTYALWLSHRRAVADALREVDNPFTREARELRGDALVRAVVDAWLTKWREQLDFELRRCCGPELEDLRRNRRGGKGAGPRIGVTAEGWCVVFRLDGPDVEIDPEKTKPPRAADVGEAPTFRQSRQRVADSLRGDLPESAVYLPAGRSGIVHSQAALGRLMSGAISGGWFEDATVGAIPGATADLMQMIAQFNPDAPSAKKRWARVADAFERELMHGRLRLDVDSERRRMMFAPEGHSGREWELQNMATSVAELAPLVLYLRHQHPRNAAVLIDEPEAHLHPDNQVALAKGLIALSRVVAPLIVATHSEFLASALSTELLGSNGDAARVDLAIFEFLFHDQDDRGKGVDVRSVPYDPDEGFEIEQFSGVARRLFEESVRRYNKGHDS